MLTGNELEKSKNTEKRVKEYKMIQTRK